MEEDLRARLLAADGIVGVSQKVAWIERPTKSGLPAITLQRIAPGRSYTMKGAACLMGTLVQLDTWGLKFLDCRDLARAAISELEGPRTVGSTHFEMSFLTAQRDERPEDVAGIGVVFRVSCDFTIWHKPAA